MTRGAALLCLAAVVVAGCGGSEASSDAAEDSRAAALARSLQPEVIQLRRDQVLERIEIALTNAGREQVVIERIRVMVEGYRSPAAIPKDSLIPAGQTVNLPWPYGKVECSRDFQPRVGRARVVLRVRPETARSAVTVRLRPTDPDRLLERIADRECTVRRVTSEVDLRFADDWRPEQTDTGVELHGALLADLRVDRPREISQVAGAIMYGLRPDDSAGQDVPEPLASLTPERRQARVPVVAYAARCDPHTIGEIKKPFEFLVWVGPPGEEPVAVTPEVGQPTKDALRLACAF